MDEGNENFEMSAPLGAVSGLVSVGRLDLPDFRGYVATTGGNIAFFQISDLNVPPQLFHVTDLPVLWSLYHAAGVLYLGLEIFLYLVRLRLLQLTTGRSYPVGRWRLRGRSCFLSELVIKATFPNR